MPAQLMPLGALRNISLDYLLEQIELHFGVSVRYSLRMRLAGCATSAWFQDADGRTHRVTRHPSGMWFHVLS